MLQTALVLASLLAPATAPQMLSATLWGDAVGVRSSGSHAYVATRGGLVVLDVSEPGEPVRVGAVPCPGWISGLEVVAGWAYVAGGDAGLHVVDLTDPSSPKLVQSVETPGEATSAVARDRLLFVADGFSGLTIYDITDPARPAFLGNEDTPGQALGVSLGGSTAFVADLAAGIAVIDIADPEHPTRIHQISYEVADVLSVDVVGGLAYVLDNIGWKRTPDMAYLRVLDVSDPFSPATLDTLHFREGAYSARACGPVAYVTSHIRPGHVFAVDISDPANLQRAGAVETGGEVWEIRPEVAGTFAAAGTGGVVRLDLSAPSSPVVDGRWWEASSVHAVALDAAYAYVADIEFGVHVVDVSDPSAPHVLASADIGGRPKRIAVLGEYGYVSALEDGLVVLSLEDPSNPIEVDREAGTCWSVGFADRYAVLAAGEDGLRVLDAEHPQDPLPVGHCDLPCVALDVAVSGNLVYVATIGAGLRIVDISDPFHPVPAGNVWPEETFPSLAIGGGYLYLNDQWDGVRVVSLADPLHPQSVAQVDLGFPPHAIAVAGDRLYTGGTRFDGSWLGVIRIADPEHPWIEDVVPIHGECKGLAVGGAELYAALGSSLTVFSRAVTDVGSPPGPSGGSGPSDGSGPSGGSGPSDGSGSSGPLDLVLHVRTPSASAIHASIRSSRPGPARLELFDSRGRLVASRDEQLAAGETEIDWRVSRLPAGMYFLRLSSEGQQRVGRVVRMASSAR